MSYILLCDSCTDLTPAMENDPRIRRIPLRIQVGLRQFVDDGSLSLSELLWEMGQCPQAPSTSCPAIGDYLALFEETPAEDIYIVTLSALLSGSHNAAEQARLLYVEEGGKKNIHVFNSCSASAGQVNVTLHIQELAESGLPFPRVVAETERYIASMRTLFVLESLENLRKNGRLSRMQAVLTGALRVKLLCGSTPEGEIQKLGQGLSIRQALVKLISRIASEGRHEGRRLVLSHCNCPDRAFFVRSRLEELCSFREILITEAGGITTVYANDGGLVAAY